MLHACMLIHFSRVWLFATPWTAACQNPLSMGFSRQENEWVAIPFSRGSSWPRNWNPVSCLLHCRQNLYCWATRETRHSAILSNISELRAWFPAIHKRKLFCLSHFRVETVHPCMTLNDNWCDFSEWTVSCRWLNHKKNCIWKRSKSMFILNLFTSKFISKYVKPIAAITRFLVYVTLEAKIVQLTEVTTQSALTIFFRPYIFSSKCIHVHILKIHPVRSQMHTQKASMW